MSDGPLFAIVDIEATAGSLGTQEGMIQFACVLMQDGEIIEEFESLVNPNKTIPIRIQKLTGIKQKDVDQAPHFDEIAHVIRDLLQDAIFVAHNVNFDYQFINEQLQSVGLKPLTTRAVDTVSLARIAFPQADYYNLTELSSYLGYEIEQAHDALYDARATAFLLKKIIAKLTQLPTVTLSKLSDLADQLVLDSKWVIDYCYQLAKDQNADLDEDLIIYDGVAIVNPIDIHAIRLPNDDSPYPANESEKENFFESSFRLRKHQGELMDAIYDYFTSDNPSSELAIEAPAGMGKSIGYLTPSAFMNKPVVISTHTKTLQDQLVDEAIPLLERVTPMKSKAVVFKGCGHYLSLTRFIQALKTVDRDDTEAFICMQILVWLTETSTGDVSELGVDSLKQHPFWQSVMTQYKQVGSLSDMDFYKRLIDQARSADFIITNHAHLLVDIDRENPVLPNYDHLIIDEAHHLPQVISSLAQMSLKKSAISRSLRDIGDFSTDASLVQHLNRYCQNNWLKVSQLHTLIDYRNQVSDVISPFFDQFIDLLKDEDHQSNAWLDYILEASQVKEAHYTKRLKQALEELIQHMQGIYQTLSQHQEAFSHADNLVIEDLYGSLQDIILFYQTFMAIFYRSDQESMVWLEAYANALDTSIAVKSFNQNSKTTLLDKLHETRHVIYISSTLSVDNGVSFFEKQIQAESLNYLRFMSPYHLQDQAKIILPKDLKPIKKLSSNHLIHELVTQIAVLMKGLDRKTLILFHSHEVLQGVFQTLQSGGMLNDYVLLAQDISGSRYKILKQFKQAKKSILFGSDTFFEGIDLPGDLLEVVVLTRLPFDSPDMPLVKNEHQQLKKTGQNIFMDDLLPRAVIKTKQAYGRLIRSEKDKGVFVILDDRYLNANYSSVFQDSLSGGRSYDQIPLHQIPKVINQFLVGD